MIDTPQIIRTDRQLMAFLHLMVPREEIREMMGPGIGEVMAAIAAQGLEPAGPWYTHHLKRPDTTFDFKICVPVDMPFAPTGRVKAGEWPAMKVARTIYHGSYDGLGVGWGEFEAWIAGSGHKTAKDLWERYVAGPESGPDSSKWITELNRLLVD